MKQLPKEAETYIDQDFRNGDFKNINDIKALAQDVDINVNMEDLEIMILGITAKYDQNDERMDAEMAPRLHKIMQLSRSDASNLGMWSYLTVVKFKEFVRHRWANSDGVVKKERYWKVRRRNALSRLWWAAELTIYKGNYDITKELLTEGQDRLEQLLMGRNFSNYPALREVILETLINEKREIYRSVMSDLSRILSTVTLESLVKDELKQLITFLIDSHENGNKPRISELPFFARG